MKPGPGGRGWGLAQGSLVLGDRDASATSARQRGETGKEVVGPHVTLILRVVGALAAPGSRGSACPSPHGVRGSPLPRSHLPPDARSSRGCAASPARFPVAALPSAISVSAGSAAGTGQQEGGCSWRKGFFQRLSRVSAPPVCAGVPPGCRGGRGDPSPRGTQGCRGREGAWLVPPCRRRMRCQGGRDTRCSLVNPNQAGPRGSSRSTCRGAY